MVALLITFRVQLSIRYVFRDLEVVAIDTADFEWHIITQSARDAGRLSPGNSMVLTEKKYKDSTKVSLVVGIFASLIFIQNLTFTVLYYEKE